MSEPSTPSITSEVQPALRRRLARHRRLVKLGGIIVLAGALLIPLALLVPVVEERATLRDGVVAEIERDWGKQQTIIGPVVVVPLEKGVAHVFPDELHAKTVLAPEQRSRGIYAAVVYTATVELAGTFHRPTPAELGVPAEQV
ncbi:MAG TPA: inner membrane CreD family protein, partial [Kofleriaceae bacterium]|nr:inner membrane CreD family protein [Kofleriaceae bacterium]